MDPADAPVFDPSGPAKEGSGIFGLPHSPEDARVIVLPVPFAATTSYGTGAQLGPEAVLRASRQVDLYDLDTGHPYRPGIAMLPLPEEVSAWDREARAEAERVIACGGELREDPSLVAALALVNARSAQVNAHVYETARAWLERGRLVALLGGDHATPLGSLRAHAERYPGLGVLHVDAHADLRTAYEGFTYSHASIMDNVLRELPDVARIVQVGIRDFCEEEFEKIKGSEGRVVCFFDQELARRAADGERFRSVLADIVGKLPEKVYVSFDIDGLDPTLCPHTGTPVPGGLSFAQANLLLGEVVRSGRTIVGVDLNEVAPGPEGDEWDGNVGARVLYKLIGWMLVSQGLSGVVSSALG